MAEWISAFNARRLAADRRNAFDRVSLEDIEFALIDQARTVLSVRAAHSSLKVLKVNGDVLSDEQNVDAVVPGWVWDLTLDWHLDWRSGIFHVGGVRNGLIHYAKLTGVEFDRSQFDRLWPPVPELVPKRPMAELMPRSFMKPGLSQLGDRSGSVPWSEQQMTAAINDCGSNDRDEAWRLFFKPRRSEHGWKLAAFREHWSKARGTKGLKGRPPAGNPPY